MVWGCGQQISQQERNGGTRGPNAEYGRNQRADGWSEFFGQGYYTLLL
ncbi:hypothetical protein OOU_Y34scaffold00590g107 [Pyricularia oryzae Y34]|uniref:Uncharacterized protein n=3 Tax=Pyricularia oryzae TaxID=318829 RepID=A0A4P7N201_PYROR|nr:hypothetical protein OOU_Y34scaffold00590g107 [Pyricularia oryzae Y34]QBZ56283.1 hypothetical protein PoMZ_01189 [Pyricularia oryzae]